MNNISKLFLGGLGLIFIYGGARTVQNELLDLKYFNRTEFGIWWPLMDSDVLVKLDAFRREWGMPVMVSPAEGGIGRESATSGSMHNVLKWGKVRAVDVFPQGMNSYVDRRRAYQIAKKVGFTGIGVYTDTKPSNMLHLDNRPQPLEWTRINGVYNYGVIA
tara:strand:- start:749 stop:1231 length:483 start_codon:yes stop_codon:yes gene_type:complete